MKSQAVSSFILNVRGSTQYKRMILRALGGHPYLASLWLGFL